MNVVQELVRHASSRFTLEVYSQAKTRAKREAQQRIVEMMLPEEGLVEIRVQRREPPELLVVMCKRSLVRCQMVFFGASENGLSCGKLLIGL